MTTSDHPTAGDQLGTDPDWLDLTTTATPLRVGIGAVTLVGVVGVVVAHRDAPLTAVLLAAVVMAYGLLSIIDAAEQRLPNRITLPLAGASAVMVLAAGIARSDIGAGLGAVGVGLLFAVVLFLLRFGMGDVKMSLTVGTIAGWFGSDIVMATMLTAAIAGGIVALALILVHRRRTITFSYGPFLAIGSVIGMIAAGPGL